MATFEFYAMSEKDQAALRENPRRCVALLRPCKPLADKLAREGGIYAPLSVDDERLLQAFHLVQQSHEGYRDVGLLAGRVEALYRQREPALYKAETISILEQWSRNKESKE